ncbi:MAG: cytochrome c oxidase subunit 3 [Acetobacterales bacterium]
MTVYRGIDVSDLSRFGLRRHPLYMGIAFLVIIEATVSATLIVSYLYLMANADAWPPPGVEPPGLLWPTVNMVLLLCSAVTMWWAGWGIDRHNQRVLTLGIGASTLLATVVLVFRTMQLGEFGIGWQDHAYGSIVWTITGFHFVHVASAVGGTAVVTFLAWRGHFTAVRQLGVVVDTLYWYFVAAAWVPFYVVLYWVPRFI